MGLVFFDPGTRQREGTWRFGHCNILRTTPSSAESRKPLPLNKGDPSWIDMRAWTYHQFCADLRAKRAKATFCLKFDLLLISSSFGILWPKELEGLDWLFKFVARVEVTVDLKNKYRTISWLHQGLVYYVLQREDVALNSMNQLTSFTHNCSILSTAVSGQKKTPKKAGGGGDAQ